MNTRPATRAAVAAAALLGVLGPACSIPCDALADDLAVCDCAPRGTENAAPRGTVVPACEGVVATRAQCALDALDAVEQPCAPLCDVVDKNGVFQASRHCLEGRPSHTAEAYCALLGCFEGDAAACRAEQEATCASAGGS